MCDERGRGTHQLAVLLHKAIGDQLTCIFVDHGLLRKGEGDMVWNNSVKVST